MKKTKVEEEACLADADIKRIMTTRLFWIRMTKHSQILRNMKKITMQ
jgi:hypothetical protein